MALIEFTAGTAAKATEVNENNYELLKQINRYTNTYESANFTGNTGTIKYLSSTEALDFRGASGVYYTSDNGATWTQRSSTNVGTTIYQDDSKAGNITTTTHYTIDGGVTWTSFTAFSTYSPRAYSVTNEGYLYVVSWDSVSDDSFIHKSEDDGATWTLMKTIAGGWPSAPTCEIQSPVDGYVAYAIYDAGDDSACGYTFDDFSTMEFEDTETAYDSALIEKAVYIDANNLFFSVWIAGGTSAGNGGYTLKWHADLTDGIDTSSTADSYRQKERGLGYLNYVKAFLPDRIVRMRYNTSSGVYNTYCSYYDGSEITTQLINIQGLSDMADNESEQMSNGQDENIGGTTYLNKEVRKTLINNSLIPSW